uniref:Uncharacterized protein n=1 Tax=Magallana gigas TaxID=29159 RepID=K1PD60_MAGGI
MALQSEKLKGKLAMVTAGKVQYDVMISYDAEDAAVAIKLKGPDYQATYSFTNSDDLRKAMYKMPYISSS